LKVLLIGYGSIGKRHYEILILLKNITMIDVVTKQEVTNLKTFKKLCDVDDINIYDYFIISSETFKHYEQLKYICSKVNEKKILVEKPLYDKKHKEIKTNNHIFTAYNLRFHPILRELKNLLKDEKIYYANIICGQYLPSWRPNQDYTKSYSGDINQGGGVLRDLSHELDYANWLFGDIDKIDFINTKISNLEINSDDIFTAIAITKSKIIINLTIDYISKFPIRRLIIHTKDNTIEVDIIKNTLYSYTKVGDKKVIEIDKIDKNYTYKMMHESILHDEIDEVCSFEDGKKIVNIIENIEYKEL